MSLLFGYFSGTVSKTFKRIVTPGKTALIQEQKQYGLLVSHELQAAVDLCKANVEQISAECRLKNRKYRDIEFDLNQDQDICLHGLKFKADSRFSPTGASRVTDIFDEPHFFVDGPNSSDLVQGALGDCWFVSALAAMAGCKGLIESCCVARDEQVGVYGFVFFRDAAWVTVIIDDFLFVSFPKFDELTVVEKALYHNDKNFYNRNGRKGGKTLYFAQSSTEGETWVALIEKAYAKLHGDYASLVGGYTTEAIEDLTGGVSTVSNTNDIMDKDRFWRKELLHANQDRLFSCNFFAMDGTRSGASDIRVDGLVGNHAYSVLRAVECNGKRFLIIRNPWGESEWTGAWSDESKEWTTEWLQALPRLEHSFGNDGEFIMEYNDFLANWDVVNRTRLFDASWTMSSQWLQVTSHPSPSTWSYGDVSFTVSLPYPSLTIIVLSQLDDRYFQGISGTTLWSFDFLVFKKGQRQPVSSSMGSPICSRSVNVELYLEAGEYVVHVRLDRLLESKVRVVDNNCDKRKISRVRTELWKARSKASNVSPDTRISNVPVPVDVLGGMNIRELEKKALAVTEERRKAHEALTQVTTVAVVEETTVASVEVTVTETDATTEVVASENIEAVVKPVDERPVVPSPDGPDTTGAQDASQVTITESITNTTLVEEPKEIPGSTDSVETYPAAEEDTNTAPIINDESENNTVFLGIRVYTHKNAPVVVAGQLRHEMDSSFAAQTFSSLLH